MILVINNWINNYKQIYVKYNKHLEIINKILLFWLMIINEKIDNDSTRVILNSCIMDIYITDYD